MYCTPPCVIHLLQALQVCMPAVHKSTPTSHSVIWHFSTVKKKLRGITQPAVSARGTLCEVSAVHNRSPTGGISFPSSEFLSYTCGSVPWWTMSQRPDSVTSKWMVRHLDNKTAGGENLLSLHASAADTMCLAHMLFLSPREVQVTWVIKDTAGRPGATGVSWLQAGW